MKRSAIKRSTPLRRASLRPVLRKIEAKAWSKKRAADAEVLLAAVADWQRRHGSIDGGNYGLTAALSNEVIAFVDALKVRPKRRYRAKGKARTETEALDDLAKQVVMLRDGAQCVRCGELEGTHCHHLRSKGANPALRWETLNLILLCPKHHLFGPDAVHSTDPRPAQEWLREYFGDRLDVLDKLAAVRKGQRTDKKLVRLQLEHELANLKFIRGAS